MSKRRLPNNICHFLLNALKLGKRKTGIESIVNESLTTLVFHECALNQHIAPLIDRKLLEIMSKPSNFNEIVFDLTQVEFVSSACLGIIMRSNSILTQKKKTLTLRVLEDGRVYKRFCDLGIEDILKITTVSSETAAPQEA